MATYRVKKGDTLGVIARRHGVSIEALQAANADLIKNIHQIQIGWVLTIPTAGSTANSGNVSKPSNKHSEIGSAFEKALKDVEKLDSVRNLLNLL